MSRRKQLWLPEVSKVERLKKEPQPRVGDFKAPKKFEILHHPLTLKFRGQLNKWLTYLVELREPDIENILSEDEVSLIGLYFFPQGDRHKWLTQDDLLNQTNYSQKSKLRSSIKGALIKLWENTKN